MTQVTGNLEKAFREKLKIALRDMSKKKHLNLISKKYAEYIRAYSASFGTGKPYRPLKRSTIEHRKYLAANNPTHKSYSLKKPNLTITGELLNSIATRATLSRDNITFKINVKGMHKKYKSMKGKGIGKKRVSNKQIRMGLAKIGRDPIQDGTVVNSHLIKLFRKAIRIALK